MVSGRPGRARERVETTTADIGGTVGPGHYFTFDGRLRRRGFILWYGLPFLVLGAVPGLLLPHGSTQVALESAVLLLVLPGVARRLHDVGLALWTFLLVYSVSPAVLALQTTGMFGERRRLAAPTAAAARAAIHR